MSRPGGYDIPPDVELGADVGIPQLWRFPLTRFRDVQLSTVSPYVVTGIVPRDGLVVVWGPPKCGKSFWTFDLLMHVALDLPYRDRRVLQGPVVFISLEGERGLGARVAAWRQCHNLGDADPPMYLLATRFSLAADASALIGDIRAQLLGAAEKRPPVAIVIDTLNRSIDGSESSDEDMGGTSRPPTRSVRRSSARS